VSADILVMLNISSRERYRYSLHIIDHASKTSWVYLLKTRETKELLLVIRRFVEEDFPKHSIVLRHFHSDGGSELKGTSSVVACQARQHVPLSSRHTPSPSVALLRASLPVAFWWWALQTAVVIINRLPTTTAQGYKTPFECVTGRPPNLKWLRIIWGCKTYALKPIAERRKDFDGKAYSGFLVGYAEQNTEYQVFVPELDRVIASVHCIFNEVIPNPTGEYFSELERLQVKEDSVENLQLIFSF
jgi:hypothetical protein